MELLPAIDPHHPRALFPPLRGEQQWFSKPVVFTPSRPSRENEMEGFSTVLIFQEEIIHLPFLLVNRFYLVDIPKHSIDGGEIKSDHLYKKG